MDLPNDTGNANSNNIDKIITEVNDLKISDDGSPRAFLRSLIGQILQVTITDDRVIIGTFVCTDRDANVIMENSWEYSKKHQLQGEKDDPRILGLALVPGRHIKSMKMARPI